MTKEGKELQERNQGVLFRTKEVPKSSTRKVFLSLKACYKIIVRSETGKVNNVIQYITSTEITDCNNRLYAVSLDVSERIENIKNGKCKTKSEKKEPYWKISI